MPLPDPLPDNPLRWDGWRAYNSSDYYARLCLTYESNPTPEQIEQNCRQLLVWWQKKLPLKNQPSNPLAQLLRGGMDEAPAFLAEARTKLLNAETRAQFDQTIHKQIVAEAVGEFKKMLTFSLGDNRLREEDEARLFEMGSGLGLSRDEMKGVIDAELDRLGAQRVAIPPPAPLAPAPAPAPVAAPVTATAETRGDAFSEFRRMLRLSRLCLDGEDMTDDQRDAMCNMGESLGLTGGQAEDLIDEYLEEVSNSPLPPAAASRPAAAAVATASKPAVSPVAKKPSAPAPAVVTVAKEPAVNTSPLARAQERQKHPNFVDAVGIELLLVPSGIFTMGSQAPGAAPNEQPLSKATMSCFYLARHPITNAQYEAFDPSHAAKRAPWADEKHPVVYVSSRDAEKFCEWLSSKTGKKYRLPTEAEWEYAARGSDQREYPWGSALNQGCFANFADARTAFPWRDTQIDDGFAATSPIGSYPRGASPFGMEDMAGNVFEWCLDFFAAYRGKDQVNPRGPAMGQNRLYRGGSWKSRAASLRAPARHFNQPDYSSNDVGFRVVCECER